MAVIFMSFGIAGDPESGTNPSGYWKQRYENGKKMIAGPNCRDLGNNTRWLFNWSHRSGGAAQKLMAAGVL